MGWLAGDGDEGRCKRRWRWASGTGDGKVSGDDGQGKARRRPEGDVKGRASDVRR